jgi:hypothetical protein
MTKISVFVCGGGACGWVSTCTSVFEVMFEKIEVSLIGSAFCCTHKFKITGVLYLITVYIF